MNKVSNWVKYCINKMPEKKGYALDLACGKGRHSIYLSKFPFKVLSVDINEESFKYFSEKTIVKLLKDIEKKENWPLVKYKFDLIVVTNFLNRDIFPMLISSLKKNGHLIYETFSEGQQKIGKPKNTKYILQSRELISLCSKISLIAYEEAHSIYFKNQSFKQRIFAINV